MLFESLISSAILLVGVAWFGLRKRRNFQRAAIWSVVSVVPGVISLISLPLLMNGLLVCLVSVASTWLKPSRWVYATLCVGATVLPYAYVGVPRYLEMRDLQERFPLESLEERLEYETRIRSEARHIPQIALMGEQESQKDLPPRRWFREQALRQLHEHFVEEFADSPGFGVRRAPSPSVHLFRLPDGPPIPLSPGSRPSSVPNEPIRSVYPPRDFPEFHWNALVDFVNQDGFGYIRDRGHVAGFQSHRFSRMPAVPEPVAWQITRLELVSLLKFDAPAAYLSDNLPRMDELRTAPTRPLDEFEIKSLKSLRRGRELIEDQSPERMRLFGAIRAMKACLSCHHGDVGDLLGAFTYDLRPAP